MTNTYRALLRTVDQVSGQNPGTWGEYIDTNFALIEEAIAGETNLVTTGGTHILSTADGAADEQRRAILRVTGELTSSAVLQVPAQTKTYDVINQTTGAFTVQVRTSVQTGQDIPQGGSARVTVESGGKVNMIACYDPNASSSIERFLGPAIVDLTSTSAVLLGVTPSAGRFLPLEAILYCSSAFSPTSVSNVTLGIGQTGSAYTDWMSQALVNGFDTAGEVVRVDLAPNSAPILSAPASTNIYVKPNAAIGGGTMSLSVRVRGIVV